MIDLRRFAPPVTFWKRAASRLASDFAVYRTRSTSIVGAIKELHRKHQLEALEMEESFGWSFEISRLNLLPVIVRLHGPWFLNGCFNHPNCNSAVNARRERREGKAIQRATYITAPNAHILAAVDRCWLPYKRASRDGTMRPHSRRDGIRQPVQNHAPRARAIDVDLIRELPYGPAAHKRPHSRPDRCQRPATRSALRKIACVRSTDGYESGPQNTAMENGQR